MGDSNMALWGMSMLQRLRQQLVQTRALEEGRTWDEVGPHMSRSMLRVASSGSWGANSPSDLAGCSHAAMGGASGCWNRVRWVER